MQTNAFFYNLSRILHAWRRQESTKSRFPQNWLRITPFWELYGMFGYRQEIDARHTGFKPQLYLRSQNLSKYEYESCIFSRRLCSDLTLQPMELCDSYAVSNVVDAFAISSRRRGEHSERDFPTRYLRISVIADFSKFKDCISCIFTQTAVYESSSCHCFLLFSSSEINMISANQHAVV